jgi:cobalt-precorrin 5A hydrolase
MIDDFADLSSAQPALERPGLVAGLGLRARATTDDVLASLDAAIAAARRDRHDIVALTTLDTKAHHPAILAVARHLDIPVIALAPHQLVHQAPNPSLRVAELANVPSVAEAAALCLGPLVLEKQVSANVTCALSRYAPSAAIAASMLATSSAGP